MKFSSYLDPKLMFLEVEGSSMQEVIEDMVAKVAANEKEVKARKEDITNSIIKREEEVSTAIGHGIAIPHARIEEFNDFIVAIGVLKTPFESNIAGTSLKDKTELIFMIISDVLKNKNILKIMSAVSKLLRKNPKIVEEIKALKTGKDILACIKKEDVEIGNRITAEDVLSPDITPVHPDTTLEEVAKRLIIEQNSGLPVVDEEGVFLGEITEKELIAFGMPPYLSLMDDLNFLTVGEPFEEYLLNEKTTSIEKIYREQEELVIIDRKAPIMEICLLIVNKGVTRIYVVEEGKYVGLVKRSDIIKKVLHI